MTSEERYGILKQPSDTCPLIDKAVELVEEIDLEIRGADRYLMRRIDRCEGEDELREMISELVQMLDDNAVAARNMDTDPFKKQMEVIRSHVIDIRQWGTEWKNLAKDMAEKVEGVQTPWDGIMLWWNELGADRWHATWVWKTCFKPLPKERNGIVI